MAFGGMQILPTEQLYAKHAFYIYDGQAIDPTPNNKENINYFSIIEMSYNEYLEFLAEYQHTYPNIITKKLKQKSLELIEESIILMGD